MHNRWSKLLFLHWRFDPATIQKLLPPNLVVDTYDGSAWVGVVPFGMESIRPVWCPPFPGLSWFLELNLRTYVVDERTGIPGVWFFSLDASQRLACSVARRFFHLPYFHARMHREETDWISYQSQRPGENKNEFRYRPTKEAMRQAEPGTLEFFLLERYVLFAWNEDRQQLSLGRVSHSPYEFCQAEVASQSAQALFQRATLPVPTTEPDSTLYSPKVQTLIYPLRLA